jgi:hypothetical protein
MSEFETFELTIIDSKYYNVLIFSLIVVLLAIDV